MTAEPTNATTRTAECISKIGPAVSSQLIKIVAGMLCSLASGCERLKLLLYGVYAGLKTILLTGDRRLSSCVFHLTRLSMGGYYHNIYLSDSYCTYQIGGRRRNRPYNIDDFPRRLWDLVTSELGTNFRGLNVVDIGPAEGFFTVELAKLGANVTVIHPAHYFIDRMKYILRFHRLERRVRVITGWYPEVGLSELWDADLVLCLGLIYHLGNLTTGLQPLVASKGTLVVESMIYKENFPKNREGYAIGFDPVHHCNNQPVCSVWLDRYLKMHGYFVTWLDKWREFSELPGNARYRKSLDGVSSDLGECVTRAALVAGRKG